MSLPFQRVEDQRPWGRFTQYAHNQEVTVKVIEVLPGAKLSVQRHQLRDELWVALDSGLIWHKNGEEFDASLHTEIWIPKGAIHAIENRGVNTARLLEIAFGNFDENDIERLEDRYGRV